MVVGVSLVDSAQYDSANTLFISMLKTQEVLPDEFCFCFGKSLCMTGYINQSIAVLNKYISLVGAQNQHSDELVELYAKLYHKEIDHSSTTQPDSVSTDVSVTKTSCDDDHVCPICQGSKVRIEKTSMGNMYKTCTYCDAHGVMSCEDYRLYMEGKLEKN